jgi:prepilin signal peptidase PulO-like enzyme (type II secretory pathway)
VRELQGADRMAISGGRAAHGMLFVLVYWQIGLTVYLPVALAFTATMTALVFIDAEHMILPNVITYPMFVIALIVRIVYPIAFQYVFPTRHTRL